MSSLKTVVGGMLTVSALAFATTASAAPVTINFGGGLGLFPPTTENGFTYSAFSGEVARIRFGAPAPAIQTRIPDDTGDVNGILRIVSSTLGETFNFLQFDLAEFDNSNFRINQITVEGFLNGASVGTESFTPVQNVPGPAQGPFSTVSPTAPLLGTTIDELRFTLPAAIRFPQSGPVSFGAAEMDNVVLDKMVVPIPSAMLLFGSGLLGLIGLAKRKSAH